MKLKNIFFEVKYMVSGSIGCLFWVDIILFLEVVGFEVDIDLLFNEDELWGFVFLQKFNVENICYVVLYR